jgi:hypothetical protein
MVSDSLVLRKLRNKLPDWFDLSAYDATSNIKLKKLLDLIEDRAYLIRDNLTAIKLSGMGTLDANVMERALKEKGLLRWPELDCDDYSKTIINDDPDVFPEAIVEPVLFSDIEILLLNMRCRRSELTIETDYKEDDIVHLLPLKFEDELRHQMLSEHNPGYLYCALSIGHNTDDEIIAELKRLLPLFRAKLGTPSPKLESDKRVGISLVKTIVNYKVLAFLDLKIWSMVSGCNFSNEFLARTLYPEPLENGDFVSSKNIAETRAPLVDNFINNDILFRKLLTWSKTEIVSGKIPYEMIVADLMAW